MINTEMFVDISGLKKTEEDSTWNKTLAVLGELIGTAILIFLGCMACLGSMKPHIIGPSMIHIAFAFGLAVMIAIQVQITFESDLRISVLRIVDIILRYVNQLFDNIFYLSFVHILFNHSLYQCFSFCIYTF